MISKGKTGVLSASDNRPVPFLAHPSVLVEEHERPAKAGDDFLQKAAIRVLDRSSCDQQMNISTRSGILTAKRKLDCSRRVQN